MSGKYSLANDYIRLDGIGLPRGVVVAHLNSKDKKITDLKDKYNKAVCYLRDANMSVKRRSKKIATLQAEIDEYKKRVNNYRLSCNELESENDKVVDMLEIVLYEYEEDMKIRHQEQIAGLIEKHRSSQ